MQDVDGHHDGGHQDCTQDLAAYEVMACWTKPLPVIVAAFVDSVMLLWGIEEEFQYSPHTAKPLEPSISSLRGAHERVPLLLCSSATSAHTNG